MDRLHQVFPKAKFIHLIRDGRDVCLSLANTKWYGVAIEKQAAYWCEMVNAGIESGRKLGEDLYIEIKYEDLVLKSEETLKKICKFLAEEYDSCILECYQSADFSGRPRTDRELTAYQKARHIHDNTKLPPQVSKTYRWRREIGVAMFEAIAGSTMDRVGQARMFRGPLRIISWGYKLAVDLAVQTRTIRRWWGLQIPYDLLRKIGIAGEGIYKEKK
ncbi:MAG: sulfotransferase [Hormoscilla sp. SP5CHS1]|nr:sulfotransferase [Hormoscilla sp. SP5CHS1]